MKNNIFWTYIKNEWKKSRLSSYALVIITAVATALLSSCLIMIANLKGSVDYMMETGKSSHFIQMHSGEADFDKLSQFALMHDYIESFQTVEFVNFPGAAIELFDERSNQEGYTNLDASVQDNGLVVQNKEFDFLVDLNNQVVTPNPGEIYLPVCMKKDDSAYEGMKVKVAGKEFIVKGFVRDSQMNSTLASSKRLLVSETDFNDLKDKGSVEYIFEYRLKSMDDISRLEQDYIKEDMPSNGPSVTYALFKLMNSISDGILVLVILLASVIVTVIGCLCIRFTLISKLEEELKQIGIMKGIGVDVKSIKKLYLNKYIAVVVVGAVLGAIASLTVKNVFLENIRLYMGKIAGGALEIILSLSGICLLGTVIIIYVKRVLKRIDEVSARSAINGEVLLSDKVTRPGNFSISSVIGSQMALAAVDIWKRKKMYLTKLLIFIFLMFLTIVPINMYRTINHRSFVKYMGVGEYDLQIDIQNADDVTSLANDITGYCDKSSKIETYNLTLTKTVTMIDENGQNKVLKVDIGDHEKLPVSYVEGHEPRTNNQIALSVNNADDLGLKVGDSVSLMTKDGLREFSVCGRYSDITNGGKTAKACANDLVGDVMRGMVAIKLKDGTDVSQFKNSIKGEYSEVKVSDIEEYIDKTFGDTKLSIKKAGMAAIFAGCLVSFMITYLFTGMLLAKDKYQIKALRNLGFARKDIGKEYIYRIIIIDIVGIVIGTILANTLGEIIAGALLGSLGVSGFRFVSGGLGINLILSVILAAFTLIAGIVALKRVE